ncbi:hypothetical protein HYALB_00012142 [Hymenoscyphus albidus]|uniref:Uncharacterized protein n=1 Tax=Hymenoscyphus albidus TaxID=595503 RepID=A0A9N9LMG7_9HELO|nr:hypothetical protein HYALB_00012142 [Hymenoscyphus albidus]
MMMSNGREPPPPEPEHASGDRADEVESTKNDEARISLATVFADEAAGVEKTVTTKAFTAPFTDGYGDFYFGDRSDYTSSKLLRRALLDPTSESDSDDSDGTTSTEVDSFKRIGIFEYEKLPLEIRRQIFRLILAPFYRLEGGNGKNTQLYTFSSIKHHREFDEDYNLTFDEFTEKKRKAREEKMYPMFISTPPGYVPKTYDEEKAEFEETRKRLLKASEVYPGRSGSYRFIPTLQTSQMFDRKNTPSMFREWIRQLSFVGKNFRKELGDAFWGRSHLHIFLGREPDKTRYFDELCSFLKDRPAVCAGVSSILVYADNDEKSWPYVKKEEVETITGRFEFLAETIRLETLHLCLSINEMDVKDLLAARGDFVAAEATRKLVVAKKFEISLQIEFDVDKFENWDYEEYKNALASEDDEDDEDDDNADTDDEDYEVSDIGDKYRESRWFAYNDMIKDKYLPQIQRLMMPNTLRKKAPRQEVSDQEKYLDSRPSY